ncbi:copper homeostasis protein CutC, partial [Paramuribaculum intestinale]
MTHDNTTHRNLLEVCAGDIESVYAASRGGAQRVELCSALADGGITPSTGFIRQAVRVPGMKVHVLIRPRGGDFLYTPEEVASMTDDIVAAREAGAHGVVIGALTPDGDIDMDACRHMMEAAAGMNVTFHRAFDLCRDPFEALDDIIALGCNRLLTSGQAASA